MKDFNLHAIMVIAWFVLALGCLIGIPAGVAKLAVLGICITNLSVWAATYTYNILQVLNKNDPEA